MKISEAKRYLKDRYLQGQIPCYGHRYSVTDSDIATEEKAKKFLDACRASARKGIVLLSVTEKDKNHKNLLKVCYKKKGIRVLETISRIHGDYKCWCIIATVNGEAG